MLPIKHSSSIECCFACFMKQVFTNFWLSLQHIRCPQASITCPLREGKIASEKIFFALESLLNALRIQKSQRLLLFNAALAIFQPSNAQNRMRHQLGSGHLRSSLRRFTNQKGMQPIVVSPAMI